jgi:hypothetical protein
MARLFLEIVLQMHCTAKAVSNWSWSHSRYLHVLMGEMMLQRTASCKGYLSSVVTTVAAVRVGQRDASRKDLPPVGCGWWTPHYFCGPHSTD